MREPLFAATGAAALAIMDSLGKRLERDGVLPAGGFREVLREAAEHNIDNDAEVYAAICLLSGGEPP